jgi:hypothetical protein
MQFGRPRKQSEIGVHWDMQFLSYADDAKLFKGSKYCKGHRN